MPHTIRTRFARDIVAEFLPPTRTQKRQRVIIICDGAPTLPSKASLVHFLSRKGFWVVYPRYRGTWESDGAFLQKPLDKDILDVIDQLSRGFKSAYDGKTYRVRPDEIFIIAGSFGGPAGILASRDPRVTKVIAISPVVDWQAPSKAEPLNERTFAFIRNAFGNGYRFGSRAKEKLAWKKLAGGTFYNPVRHADEINGSKLLIFHAKNDESVRAREVVQFARRTGATLKLFKTGGHLSPKIIVPKYWKQIAKFLRS